jgi:hypothetical protein
MHFSFSRVSKKLVGQLRGGVNQLLPCLNNYGSFKLFIEILNDDHNNAGKQTMALSASFTYMRNTETDISQGNPCKVKTSFSLYDK